MSTTRSADAPGQSRAALSMVKVSASLTSSHMRGAVARGNSEYVATQVTTPSSASRCAIGANCHFSPTAHTPPWMNSATGWPGLVARDSNESFLFLFSPPDVSTEASVATASTTRPSASSANSSARDTPLGR